MRNSEELPAILGGRPVRPQGPPVWPPRDPAVISAIHHAALEGAWGHYFGPAGNELRRILREFHNVEHVRLCSSGTAAVELALRGVGVGPGDEVVLAAYDFKANFTDVLALGATPVLVDVRPDNWQLQTADVAAAISPSTKAVLASHLHGGAVDIAHLREVIAERPIAVIEDACQCPGARIGDRRAGTLGDVGVLSFGGSKLTAAGRGGAILTNRQPIIERIKRHTQRGNELSPLSELQAAALVPQWRALDERNERRALNARLLHERLGDDSGLRTVNPPPTTAGHYKIALEYDPSKFQNLPREQFCQAMRAEGIAFSPGFRGLHRIHASRRFRAAGRLPVADRVDESVVVLHHPVLLGTSQEMEEILQAVSRVRRAAAEIFACFPDPPPPMEPDDE